MTAVPSGLRPVDQALPALATVALHAVLIALLTLRWGNDASQRVIEARKLTPQVINAKLVSIDEYRPKAKPKSQAPPARREPARAEAPKAAAPKPAAPKPAAAQAEPKPKTEPAKATPAEPKPPRMTAEELAELSRRELQQSIAAEESTSVAVTAEEMAASYAALIQRTVVNYWSRPPSARNGMEVMLSVQLIPSGDVVSVSVINSSGSLAFDRSAINAVEKAGSFPELAKLPSREFEQTFRRFRLLFRPEDLRY